jgi:hypothetical protein
MKPREMQPENPGNPGLRLAPHKQVETCFRDTDSTICKRSFKNTRIYLGWCPREVPGRICLQVIVKEVLFATTTQGPTFGTRPLPVGKRDSFLFLWPEPRLPGKEKNSFIKPQEDQSQKQCRYFLSTEVKIRSSPSSAKTGACVC